MTDREIEFILNRDMPGWRLVPGTKMSDNDLDPSHSIRVTNGSTTKTAIINRSGIVGAQG